MTKNYDVSDSERVPIIMSWIGQGGFNFVQTLIDEEQEMCKNSAGIFSILNEKFKLQHNKNCSIVTIL